MKFKTYAIVARAVEEGVALGYRRAHKHVDNPAEDDLRDALETEVLNALCEVLEFDPPEEAA